MSAVLTAPAAQVCAFALGCALIHAARAHARAVTWLLAAAALGLGLLVLLFGSLAYAPDEAALFDEVTVYAAPG